jgi:hypothetical protein
VADEFFRLVVLALPTACVAWTVTHEEIFREPRDWLTKCSQSRGSWLLRKLCFAATCDYCMSHYIAAGAIALTGFTLFTSDWRGFLLGWLTLTAIANIYLAVFSHIRVEIGKERAEMVQAESRTKKAG